MQVSDLEIGRIYFNFGFEDDNMSYPIINSYEYMGVSDEQVEAMHIFRIIGAEGDTLELDEKHLNVIMGLIELGNELQEWARDNPRLSVH